MTVIKQWSFSPTEFVGWEEGDMPYGILMDTLEIEWEIEAEEEKREAQEESLIQKNFQRDRSPMFLVRQAQVNKNLKIKVILEWKFRNLSTEMVANMNQLTIQQVKDILYEFHQILSKTRKSRKYENLRRWKIKEEHVAYLQQFVSSKQITGFKLWDARNHLLSNFPSLIPLSLTTVSKILKKQIGMSYKKLGELNPKKTTPEHMSNLSRWLQTILGLFKIGFYVIFADEFLINRNTFSTYGWAKRGMPGRIKRNSQQFRMSFVVAHSSTKVEGIMGTKMNMNTVKYLCFLKSLFEKLKTVNNIDLHRVVLVVDNWRFHRSKDVRQELERQGVLWLFIPSYSPEINAWEKIINYIKSLVKRQVGEGR